MGSDVKASIWQSGRSGTRVPMPVRWPGGCWPVGTLRSKALDLQCELRKKRKVWWFETPQIMSQQSTGRNTRPGFLSSIIGLCFHPSFGWNPILSTGHVAGHADHNAECDVAGPFQAQWPENRIFGCGKFFILTQHGAGGRGWGGEAGAQVPRPASRAFFLMLWEVFSSPFISSSGFDVSLIAQLPEEDGQTF